MILKTCTILLTSSNLPEFLFDSIRNKETKYGRMAKTSIMFIPPFTNCHFEGLVANLSMYSSVNQVMQTASTMASLGLSICLPSESLTAILGIVLRVKATVDRTIKLMEMTATT